MPDVDLPEPTRYGEVVWLEPYPDMLLDELPGGPAGPEARFETMETVSLAFVTALQLLPPRQRAVLILRDVLGFHAGEVARILDSTEESVTSALKRARASLAGRMPPASADAPGPSSAVERELVDRFARAFEAADVDAIVELLTDEVRLAMPPLPMEWHGRDLAARFLRPVFGRRQAAYRVVPTRANRQPALGVYARDPATGVWHAMGLLVLTLAGAGIGAITRFETGVLASFGLPRTMRD
jgi:RNA polymerase sigma-70 factor (TIGR02960 family)